MKKINRAKINKTINTITNILETILTIVIAILVIVYRAIKRICKYSKKIVSHFVSWCDTNSDVITKTLYALIISLIIAMFFIINPRACAKEDYYPEYDGHYKKVWYNELNVRSEPNTDSKIIDVLERGDKVRITGKVLHCGEWTWYEIYPYGWVCDVGLN